MGENLRQFQGERIMDVRPFQVGQNTARTQECKRTQKVKARIRLRLVAVAAIIMSSAPLHDPPTGCQGNDRQHRPRTARGGKHRTASDEEIGGIHVKRDTLVSQWFRALTPKIRCHVHFGYFEQ